MFVIFVKYFYLPFHFFPFRRLFPHSLFILLRCSFVSCSVSFLHYAYFFLKRIHFSFARRNCEAEYHKQNAVVPGHDYTSLFIFVDENVKFTYVIVRSDDHRVKYKLMKPVHWPFRRWVHDSRITPFWSFLRTSIII